MTATWTWLKTSTGYEANDGRARMVREFGPRDGKRCFLVLADGRRLELPRRATFDHAEGILLAVAQ
jgi:hypothetical protein